MCYNHYNTIIYEERKQNESADKIMMKTISDIRLYRSREPNISGHSLPSEFAGKKLHIIASRIAMKLREAGFSMGDFDHLYINFTTCPVEGGSAPAKRELDTYHPWYRYYDVEVGKELYDTLGENADTVIFLMEAVLCRYFATEEFGGEKIRSCINEAVTNGENMLMKYKEKKRRTGNPFYICGLPIAVHTCRFCECMIPAATNCWKKTCPRY